MRDFISNILTAFIVIGIFTFVCYAAYKAANVKNYNTYCMDPAPDGGKQLLFCSVGDGPALVFDVGDLRKCVTLWRTYSCRGFIVSKGQFVTLNVKSGE